MINELTNSIIVVATAIVGVAIISVLVSRNAQTPAVIQAAGSAFGNDLAVAVSPVTGANTPINLGYPNASGLNFSGLNSMPYSSPFGGSF